MIGGIEMKKKVIGCFIGLVVLGLFLFPMKTTKDQGNTVEIIAVKPMLVENLEINRSMDSFSLEVKDLDKDFAKTVESNASDGFVIVMPSEDDLESSAEKP